MKLKRNCICSDGCGRGGDCVDICGGGTGNRDQQQQQQQQQQYKYTQQQNKKIPFGSRHMCKESVCLKIQLYGILVCEILGNAPQQTQYCPNTDLTSVCYSSPKMKLIIPNYFFYVRHYSLDENIRDDSPFRLHFPCLYEKQNQMGPSRQLRVRKTLLRSYTNSCLGLQLFVLCPTKCLPLYLVREGAQLVPEIVCFNFHVRHTVMDILQRLNDLKVDTASSEFYRIVVPTKWTDAASYLYGQ